MADQIQSYNYEENFNFEPEKKVKSPASAPSKKNFMPIILLGIIGVILIGALFFLLFGRQGRTPTSPSDSSQQVVIQFWGAFLTEEMMNPLIQEYKSIKPNVTIEYANKWQNEIPRDVEAENYKNEINRVLKANDPVEIPDIFMIHNTWTGDYERFTASSTSLGFDEFSQNFYPVVSDNFAPGGIVKGVPLWLDTFAILFNRDLLNIESVTTPPSNWADFKRLSLNLTRKNRNVITQGGFAAGNGTNVSFAFEMINLLLLQNRVSMLNQQKMPDFAQNPDALEAFSFFKDFGSSNGSWSLDLKNDSSSFIEKKAAMIFAPSYRYRDILKYKELYQIDFEIGIAPVPQLEGQKVNWADYWGCVVSQNRPNIIQSWEFLAWLSEPSQLKKIHENVKKEFKTFGTLYPRSDMKEELENDPYLNIFNDSLPFAKSWYMVKGLEVKKEFLSIINSSISSSSLESLQRSITTLFENKGRL